MKILFTNFHRDWYGQPLTVLLIARELAARGHAVTLACPAGSALARRGREVGLPVLDSVRFRKTRHKLDTLRDVRLLGRFLRDEGYDLVHSHGSQDTWSVALARRLYRLPARQVMTRCNSKRIRTHAANRWLYRDSLDHLVLSSRALERGYESFLRSGVLPPEKVQVIPHAYDTEEFCGDPQRHRVRRELGLNGEPLVGLVGRIDRYKGHRVLLSALGEVLQRHGETRILFVGSGSEEAPLRLEVERRGLDRRVHFLGFREDVPRITGALDVSVLPSLGVASSPTVLKEALALGVPVVAADTGGIREVVDHGETGFIVPSGDSGALAGALLLLLNDRALARRMGSLGPERMRERFSPRHCADAHEALYERLLDQPSWK